MHFLAGSTREWDEVVALLRPQFRLIRLDLPGFGSSADVPGYTVAEMADSVQSAIDSLVLTRYSLVGHSMSGKVALVLARRAHDSSDDRLAGLVLVAPSPPSPEPFTPEKRSMMLRLLGTKQVYDDADGRDDRTRARAYITKNELRDIPRVVEERASLEVLRMNPAAWTAWIEHGSREDWAARVGQLTLPAMVIAGEQDLSLGPPQQRQFTLPHLPNGQLETVPNCSHLIPMERPAAMATYLTAFAQRLAAEATIPAPYREFLLSDRVAPKTRQILAERLIPPPIPPDILTPLQLETLRAALDRIIPQPPPALDLAAPIVAQLASGVGDGWRYDVLPPDRTAYREALDRLAAANFLTLTPAAQDATLASLAADPGSPDARWFEDLRAAAVTRWIAHPATLARIGYSGVGIGGATTPHRGFTSITPNHPEPWEPTATTK